SRAGAFSGTLRPVAISSAWMRLIVRSLQFEPWILGSLMMTERPGTLSRSESRVVPHRGRPMMATPIERSRSAASVPATALMSSGSGTRRGRSRYGHVIDGEIVGQAPAVADRVVGNAHERIERGTALRQRPRQLRRPHELAPVVRTARQPAQQIFGADDGEREGFRC